MTGRGSAWPFGRCGPVIVAAFLGLLAAGSARPQTPACEQLKTELAARIDASGARGYALETVPAGTPAPPGAKAIGTCEAGRYKVLYRRWAPASSAAAAVDAPAPASAPPLPDATRRSPAERSVRAGRAARTPASAAASQAVAPSTVPAAAVPMGDPDPLEDRKAAAGSVHSPRGPGSAQGRGGEPNPSAGATGEVERPRASDPVVAHSIAAKPTPAPPADNAGAKVSLGRRAAGVMVEHWPWLLALVLLPLAAWLWSWLAYRRAYDAAGLPRGPRL